MKFKGIIALMVICSFLTGCCSIVGQSVFPVTVNSNPSGAIITITDEHGIQMYNGTTPTTLTLRAGESYFHAKEYTIKFSKPGYGDQVTVLKAGLDGWYFGNILWGVWCPIGFLILDPITGKMWKLSPQAIGNLSPIGTTPDVVLPASAAPAVSAAPSAQGNGGNIVGNKTSLNKRSHVLQIICLNQVPKELRDKMVRVN